jgi:hypothetical protein
MKRFVVGIVNKSRWSLVVAGNPNVGFAVISMSLKQ